MLHAPPISSWISPTPSPPNCKGKNYEVIFSGLFLCAFAKLRKATISFVVFVWPSVPPSAWNNSSPTGWIFMKFGIWGFIENISSKFKFRKHLTRITSTLHEDQHTSLPYLAPFCLDNKFYVQKLFLYHAVYEIM